MTLPTNWTECETNPCEGITKTSDRSKVCRNCREDAIRKELRGGFDEYAETDRLASMNGSGLWDAGSDNDSVREWSQ